MKNQIEFGRFAMSRIGILILAALAYPAALTATTIQVSGKSTGFFGSPNSGDTLLLTLGLTVSAPVSIEIGATGIVTDFNNQGQFLQVDPNGTDFTSIFGDVLPLQEAQGLPPNTPTTQLDALMGAFVPAAIAGLPNFVPEDAAKVGPGQVGINAASLFFIGAGPFTFSTPGAGTLYLGINDSFVADNGGGFSVTATVVPEPSGASLLIVGLIVGAGVWARWHQRSTRTATLG
jgi:hypothetical protein